MWNLMSFFLYPKPQHKKPVLATYLTLSRIWLIERVLLITRAMSCRWDVYKLPLNLCCIAEVLYTRITVSSPATLFHSERYIIYFIIVFCMCPIISINFKAHLKLPYWIISIRQQVSSIASTSIASIMTISTVSLRWNPSYLFGRQHPLWKCQTSIL